MRTAARLGLEDQIDFRLGDGLSVLEPGEADVIVIAIARSLGPKSTDSTGLLLSRTPG